MENIKRQIIVSILVMSCSFGAHSYELVTHGNLTNSGYGQSILVDNDFLDDIGVTDSQVAFGIKYYRFTSSWFAGSDVDELDIEAFEQSQGRMPADVSPLSISGWLMRGAIREDDHVNRRFPCRIPAPNPQYTGITDRPKNHFYNPLTDSPLEIAFFDLGERAPMWGLGSTEPFQIPQQEDTGRDNHYTLFDTIEAMYRALTGHSSAGSNTIMPGNMAPGDGDGQETVRNYYWATTFRALGDTVHLIQDMAQPQHTRNDAHSGACAPWVQNLFTGHASVYEKYVESRASNAKFDIPGAGSISVAPLNYGSYPIPEFDDYASFFSTRHIDSSITTSRGLADYSHRGFFSAGTNLGQNNYPLPNNSSASYTPTTYNLDWEGQPLPNGQTIDLLQGNVNDSITGANDTVALTTSSVWDEFLVNNSASPVYTLTKKNYDDMADLLIPRAVSYSAGFINYFFRGRVKPISVSIQSNGQNNELLLVIENQSTTGAKTYDLSNGSFDLYYKADDGFLKPMTIQAGGSLVGPLANGAQHQITATIPQDIDPLEPRPFTVVYTGLIGQEPGIIGYRFTGEKFYINYYSSSFAVKHDYYGNNVSTYTSGPSGWANRNIAVIDGDRLIDDETSTVFKNGAPFINIPNTPNGLWVNSQNLYIAALSDGVTGPVVDVYTHGGSYIESLVTITPFVPFGTWQTISTSETHLCVVDDGESVGTLFDINGNLVKELVSYPQVGNVLSCGSAADRHFLHVNIGGVGYIQVYDNAGNDMQYGLQLDAGAASAFGMAMSDNHIVIPAFYSNSAYVIRRERDGMGNETLEFGGVINLSGPSIYPYDASIDLTQPYQ